jgi:hypothetical protein
MIYKTSLKNSSRPTQRAPDGWWAPPKKRILASSILPFRRLALPAAGNASRWAATSKIKYLDFRRIGHVGNRSYRMGCARPS